MEKYIQPFISTTVDVFKSFVGIEIEADTPYFIDNKDKKTWSISGIIGLTGEAQGALVLSLEDNLALELTTILTGEESKSVDDNVLDAVGEIINIIAGNVKKDLEEIYRLVISLPTIVQGEGHSTFWASQPSTRAICIPFTYNKNFSFAITVALKA